MKKLSKITESIWSDIQDRSSGDTVRKEDDINLMSIEDFCGYLNDNYISEDGHGRTYKIYYVSKVLSIAVLMDNSYKFYSIKYDYGYNMIYLNDEIEDSVPELCQKLKNNFKVVKNRVSAIYTKFFIYPSDGSECTNRFFVDVINFIIDNADENELLLKNKHINESIWSDIQDRSAGDTVRKEDDINLMSGEDFCDYLNDNYISKSKYKILYSEHSKCIHIPILDQFTSVLLNISYNYNSNTITMNDDVESLCPELCKMIKKKFKVAKKIVSSTYTQFIIFPPDGSECTNRFFVDVINFIIDNADENVLLIKKKHINESIWSDIQDRSSGDTVRKEDDINLLDRDGLCDYIYDLYKQIALHPLPLKSYTSPTRTYFSIPIFRTDYKVYRLNCVFDNNKISNITLMASDADVKDFKQALIDNFNATINSDGALTITAKDGTVSNQVCMDLIKTIVENAPHPYLKKREN